MSWCISFHSTAKPLQRKSFVCMDWGSGKEGCISDIISYHIHNTQLSEGSERACISIISIGWHSPLKTVQSVAVYSLAFPFPSAFYTQSPSCHDTQALHKYSWYLWGYIPSRLENRKPLPYVSLACSRAYRRSIHSVPQIVWVSATVAQDLLSAL